MNLENAFELEIPNGEVKHIDKDGTILWQRAIEKTTEKGGSVSFNNTRYAGDGESYPAFPYTQVLPSVKAYGKAISATPQEELWGRYVPVQPGGSYPFKTTNMFLFMPYNQWLGYSLDQVSHPGYYWDNTSGSKSINFPVEANTTYTVKHTNEACTINRIAQYNGLFPSTEERGNNYPITMSYNSGGALDYSVTTLATTKSLAIQFSSSHINSILNELVITENNAEWIAVKDIVANTYGYLNRTTNRFLAVPGMTGTEIKRIDYLQSTGVEYITTENQYTVSNTDTIKTKYQYIEGSPSARIMSVGMRTTTPYFNLTSSSGSVTATLQYGLNEIWVNGPAANFTTVYESVISGDNLTINGTKYSGSKDVGTYSVTDVLELFRGGYNSTYRTASMKLYYFEIEGKINLVPVKVGTTGYLLDTIEWKLYANQGTGAFTCGSEIPNRLILPYTLSGHRGEIKTTRFNQLVNYAKGDPTATTRGITFTNNNNGSFTFTGTCNQQVSFNFSKRDINIVAGHKYFYDFDSFPSGVTVRIYSEPTTYIASNNPGIFTAAVDGTDASAYLIIPVNVTLNQTVKPMLFDLTQMFGEGNEPTTIAEAREAIANVYGAELDYYSYTTGTVKVYADGEHNLLLGTQGVVDLGTLTWVKHSTHGVWTTVSLEKAAGLTNILAIRTNYSLTDAASVTSMADMTYRGHVSSAAIYIRDDDAYDNMTVAEFKASLSGKHLFYQRATDTAFVAPIEKQVKDLLYSANSYKDLQTGEVWRDWAIKVLDGTENWQKTNIAFQVKQKFPEDVANRSQDNQPFLNFYTSKFYTSAITTDIQNGEVGFNVSQLLTIRDDRFTTAEEFKAYLAEQYANGTPIIIIYPLANPTTTAGTADVFRLTTKGNKTLSSDVAGTGVQATYLGE